MKKPNLFSKNEIFHTKRRQNFLYEKLYENTRQDILLAIEGAKNNINETLVDKDQGEGSSYHLTFQESVFKNKFWLWTLDYTAGVGLENLAKRFSEVVDELVVWGRVNKKYRLKLKEKYVDLEVDLRVPAVDFTYKADYQEILQIVGVAIILRDTVSIKKIISEMHGNRGFDSLFDRFLEVYDESVDLSEKLIFEESHELLFDAFLNFDNARDEQAIESVKSYLKIWYKNQVGARWFNGHKEISDDLAWYYGYWSFEAGAACYLLNLNDDSIDSMFYPRDLVAYGRKLRSEDKWTSNANIDALGIQVNRCEAGQPCPRSGYWFTPAKNDLRQYFELGEIMPDIKNPSWITIWQWVENQ